MRLNLTMLMRLKESAFLASVPVALQTEVLAAAYATFKVAELNVPSTAVEDLHAFYMANIQQIAYDSISEFNESIAINTDKCKYLIHKLWCIKYNAIHWNSTIIPEQGRCYFESVANVNLYIDRETLAFLNENAYSIVGITNTLKAIDEVMEKERLNDMVNV